ncbi:recombinase family protein [Sansalvadorimonas verongulae]|uniref:recombinase family protein n=1 Tax=Sansalvadorimonas verongulae TaxID=2172824 RepID=UPI0012BC71D8|nr:recombinase family protein [Sansalvadorimonas verongulae]MTI13822.1 recombinase family protein [Sansalvadorimonas verongulae]
MNKSRVYSYIRFSTPEQAKGHSSKRQADYARVYAAEHDLVLDESLTMKDEGLSAFHSHHIQRGAFGLFLAAVEAGRVPTGSVLIVEALDRISRAEPIIAQGILTQIIVAGVKVVTAIDGQEYDRESVRKEPMKLVYSLLLFVRSNEESETKRRRVRDSIKSQIRGWIENGSGKIIRNGADPLWCEPKKDKTGFELVPDRVDIVRLVVSLYRDGWGFNRIIHYLNDENVPTFKKQKRWYVQYWHKVLRNRVLIGERDFEVDGEKFVIENYYPAILTREEFATLQHEIDNRASTKGQRKIPSLFTGMKVAYCGHCGHVMSAQNYTFKAKKDGHLSDGFRRIRCAAESTTGQRCKNTKSLQVVIFERALVNYCSDRMELSSMLQGDDKASGVKTRVSVIRADIDKVTRNINSLADKFIALDNPPSSLVERLRKMEEEKKALEVELDKTESELVTLTHVDRPDLVEQWQEVAASALAMDEAARLKVRQLVKQTFKRIEIFRQESSVRMILHFHNGLSRILDIDQASGELLIGGDVESPPWFA